MKGQMIDPSELLAACEQAARAGAEELVQWQDRFQTRQKAPCDLVTDADLASEQAIRGVISARYPEHGILGEESAVAAELEKPYCWIVDPLDGTTNYVHGYPCYGPSVAIAYEGQLLAGVVYDPVRDECFAAARGQGARLNDRPIRVSGCTELGQSLLAVSFPPRLDASSPDLRAFLATAPRCQAVRRTGSAALNLAYVACGRLDGHWAHEIHAWDAAAGILLVQEAGGTATACSGSPFDLRHGDYLAASSTALHGSLVALI
jgi:myo-inositol-1(or 4)-monophosphatase